jgi:hypothetical protein
MHDSRGRVASVLEMHELKPVDPEVPTIPCHPGCFPAGTLVQIAGRIIPIEDLRVGDEVLSIDADGRAAPRQIEQIFTTKNKLFELRTEAGPLFTTRTQPVCLVGGGFAAVGALQPGDQIWRWRDGRRHAVAVKEIVPTDRLEPVFNLVLGENAVFVAGDFLVRGKPPAEDAAKRKGLAIEHHQTGQIPPP